ncbi:MAG TPA: hypothetical protein VGR11_00130 [Solirubrobacteraceae bacterium]|nr:hypothetical protein [Solirubrobacteraceae bacterium]
MADLALWVTVIVLILSAVVLVNRLKAVLSVATSIPPKVDAIAGVATAASRDLDAVAVLLTTQGYIASIKDSVLDYGGSLNAALPDY